MLSQRNNLAGFGVRFLDKKPQTLMIPICSATLLYDAAKCAECPKSFKRFSAMEQNNFDGI